MRDTSTTVQPRRRESIDEQRIVNLLTGTGTLLGHHHRLMHRQRGYSNKPRWMSQTTWDSFQNLVWLNDVATTALLLSLMQQGLVTDGEVAAVAGKKWPAHLRMCAVAALNQWNPDEPLGIKQVLHTPDLWCIPQYQEMIAAAVRNGELREMVVGKELDERTITLLTDQGFMTKEGWVVRFHFQNGTAERLHFGGTQPVGDLVTAGKGRHFRED